MTKREIDETTGIETTGHEWDGIRELDNPMPRWWLWTFYATILFSIGYILYYPAIPLIERSTMGFSGETNRGLLKQELEHAKIAQEEKLSLIASGDLETINNNEELKRFAVAGGQSAYKVYCSQCHGSGAQGGPGYPNLNDDDWLWGGDLGAIYTSIKHGIRNEEDEDARYSEMPSFGADGILDNIQISNVTQFILKLSKQDYNEEMALAGVEIFNENCAACHSANGVGNRELGAPNLSDAISLYGHDAETITAQIKRPRHGVMPAWGGRLSDETVKQLTLFVHSLGGGEKMKAE